LRSRDDGALVVPMWFQFLGEAEEWAKPRSGRSRGVGEAEHGARRSDCAMGTQNGTASALAPENPRTLLTADEVAEQDSSLGPPP
jgi:hypothetical protein